MSLVSRHATLDTMADIRNYTPIDDLIEDQKKKLGSSISHGTESEPARTKNEYTQTPDVQLDESEHAQEKERPVEDYLQNSEEKIELDPQLKKAGLQVIDHSALSPFQKVQLPLSDDLIIEGKQKPITSSWRWLSEFSLFILAQAHISLKKIHGKVIRVLKR